MNAPHPFWSRVNLRGITVVTLSLVLVVGLSVPFYVKLKRNGLKAEAKIILGYIATLQAAHHTDSGRYVSFEEFYGSQINGRENCARPDGAAELGFSVKGCDRVPDKGGLRYAFRVLPEINPETQQPDLQYGYRAEAVSGSDVTGEDYICSSSNKRDEWLASAKEEPHNTKNCE